MMIEYKRFTRKEVEEYQSGPCDTILASGGLAVRHVTYKTSCIYDGKVRGMIDIHGTMDILSAHLGDMEEKLTDLELINIELPDRVILDVTVYDWRHEWYGYHCTFMARKVLKKAEDGKTLAGI